ncbi:MAG: hypothetical protein U0793_09055 [Gemmataceae bacterium]
MTSVLPRFSNPSFRRRKGPGVAIRFSAARFSVLSPGVHPSRPAGREEGPEEGADCRAEKDRPRHRPGHSYEKHVVDEKLFPEVKSRDDFIDLIANVLANRTHHRDLENDREAYYDRKTTRSSSTIRTPAIGGPAPPAQRPGNTSTT